MRLCKSYDRSIMISLDIFISCLVAFITAVSYSQSSLARDSIEGVWIDDTGRGAVQIAPCGHADGLCGYIVWLHSNKGLDGRLLRDVLNPNPAKRWQFICGLQVIGQLKPQTSGAWDQGWIYDPKQGRSFNVAVRRLSEDQIEVTGYLGAKFLGRKLIWERAPQGIKPCEQLILE